MAIIEYASALKLGKKSYQDAVAKGEYPYLPVLDSILSDSDIATEVPLGVIDIPLGRIVGTKTAGRTQAFAKNFMPLLADKSEFAAKWSELYDYQVEEGIQDPILVYEYMDQFYVQEGNKRVSVMKYLGAYSIRGDVIRMLPKKTDTPECRLYYEFLDFYELSQNCDVWFSKEGSYARLLELMGKKPKEAWSEDDHMIFNSAYSRFAKAFLRSDLAGGKLNCSDVFLIYTEIFEYETVAHQTDKEMSEGLVKIRKEVKLADSGSPVELVESPEAVEKTARKPMLLNWLVGDSIDPEQLRLGFIYTKTTESSSWTYSHELGRHYLEEAFDGRLATMAYDGADTEDEVEAAIQKAIADGCNLIFTTAPQMAKQSVRLAVLHPEVKIYNCSINLSYSAICTYYARVYEAKFLMGAIAAALSKTGRLGYIADYPIYGTVANVNAFALGARMIDPEVKVYLEWSRTRGADARTHLEEMGVRYISGDDMITPNRASREYGLYRIMDDGSLKNFATPICHWGKFYERIVRLICKGSDEKDVTKGKKAVNYWWGMSADVIDVICADDMPHGTHRLIEFLKNSIREGSFHPFDGLIYSQQGVIRCREGQSLAPEDIVSMNWLAENVIGRIPDVAELNDEAKGLVAVQGVTEKEEGKTEE